MIEAVWPGPRSAVACADWTDLPLDNRDTWTPQVAAVTVADIRRAFQRVLAPDRMVSVIVGGKAP